MNDSEEGVQEYPWYAIGTWESLQQGDIILECPVLVPPNDFAERLSGVIEGGSIESPIQVDVFNLVVMSQSCDLENDKVDQVLLCGIFAASEYSKSERIAIAKEHRPSVHMVERCDVKGFEFERRVIEFRTIYTLPKAFVMNFARSMGKRIRILPPYREHLSQAFARYFMRVGLPRTLRPE